MRLGISSYTYTWGVGVPGHLPPQPLTAADLVRRAADNGLGCVQIADNLPLDALADSERRDLRTLAAETAVAIEVGARGLTSDRLERYRRVAAQAPEYRKALDVMREKEGRRFFLKNTAANLAGAELQELVRAAIEGNGGRITTSQNQGPRDEGRFRQITVTVQFFASTPALQKVLYALEGQPPYLSVENMTLRPLNAFRGFKPGPGQEPEINVQLDVAGFAFVEPDKK